MKKVLCVLTVAVCLMCSGLVYAESKVLTWDAPVTNEDGTPLTDLGGYKIYNNDVEVVDVGNVLTHTMDVTEGSYVFTVRAYDTAGNESINSNEVTYELKICPAPPENLVVE